MSNYTPRILPLPELLDRSIEWEIRDSEGKQAYVDFKTGQMVVPLDDSEGSEYIRAHEAMHVAITPRDAKLRVKAEVFDRTIQAAEDARVNAALRTVGIPTDVDTGQMENAMSYVLDPRVDDREMAHGLLGFHGRMEGEILRKVAADKFPKALEAADRVIERYFQPYEDRGEIAPFENTVAASEYLTDYLDGKIIEEEPQPGDGEPSKGSSDGAPQSSSSSGKGEPSDSPSEAESSGKQEQPGSGGDSNDKKEEKEEGKSDDDGEGDQGDRPERSAPPISEPLDLTNFQRGQVIRSERLPPISKTEEKEIKSVGLKTRGYGKGESGELIIEHPELLVPHKAKKSLKVKSDEIGEIPIAWHRYNTDQRIFRKKLFRKGSAAVLIDVSGSMQLAETDIDWILDECPASIVAIYSGMGRRGILRIIVDRGRKMDVSKLPQGEYTNRYKIGMGLQNVVDVPCLEWLANRKEERKLWICDGVITGTGDSILSPKEIRKAVYSIQRGRIIRVNHLRDLKKSHLLRFDIATLDYQAESQYTMDGFDLNGPGCSLCNDPNCSWWAEYKRNYLNAGGRLYSKSEAMVGGWIR